MSYGKNEGASLCSPMKVGGHVLDTKMYEVCNHRETCAGWLLPGAKLVAHNP